MMQTSRMRLIVDRLGVLRGAREILSGISMDVQAGELVALVGPNGAGKSTLIKAMLGLVECETGAVMLDGAPVTRLSARERARQMAYLPQDRAVAWSITGGDLAALGRFAWGGAAYDRLAAADREMVDSALEQAGALSLKHRLIHELSGGEQARLHLARLLASRAPVLFADEPIAALDPRHQLEAMKVLRSQADKGGSVICALHDLNLARRHADRIAVLHQGRLHAFAAPETALTERVLAEVFGVKPARDGGLALL